jgi:transcriptional regulator with XRE-family HTH domain
MLRAVRRRRRLTQKQVARLAGVSQARVSMAELGRLDSLSIRAIDAIAGAIEVHLTIEARWHGTDGHRLLDRFHASIVEVVVGELTALGWTVLPEYTFNHYGDRGSVDVIAWLPLTRSLLIIEVKSEIVDIQDLFATQDRKVRVVPGLLRRERGWNAATVSRLVVLPGTTANRSIVARHIASFAAVLPSRMPEIRRWLRAPAGSIAGVWFISPTRVARTKNAERVRNPSRVAGVAPR